MTTNGDEPHHRQWLHALERDCSVPGTAMQVARILADYAASRRGGYTVSVTYRTLRKQTHRRDDTIRKALKYLTDHGWLMPHAHKPGQRVIYDLIIQPGTSKKALQLLEQLTPLSDHSSNWSGSDTDRSSYWSTSTDTDRSNGWSGTTPVAGAQPLQRLEHERHTSGTSLSPETGTLHAALSAAVPGGVTEREFELALSEMKSRGAKSPTAVLRTEIRDGGAPALMAEIRSRRSGPRAEMPPSPCGECDHGWVEDDQGRAMHCPKGCPPTARESYPT